ncbi:MAG: hypothetical protein JJT77_01665 [Crocinitomicaceae bacterium]|jgi:hypothetical protein|nr:hypothetical protein [Crocinitomicaceae bacterium]
MDWSILKELGFFTAIGGALTYLIKTLGKHFMNQNLEIHKMQLNQQLESHKAELELINVKQSRLHDKRIETIQELYEKLTEFYMDLDTLIRWKNVTGLTDEEIKKQQFEEANKTFESGSKFSRYYLMNKLYFSKEMCETIDEIIKEMRSCQYDLTIQYQWINLSADLQMNSFKQAKEKLEKEVPVLKEQIETKFREILGVE